MIVSCIKAYIVKNRSVKISDLGMFELSYREAGVHPIRQDFTPPGEYLVFTPNEKEDGADFAAYVAEEKGMELSEACTRIAEWVQEVRQALESRQEYALGSMGSFVMGNVRMEFVPALDPDLSPNAFGLSSFSLRNVTEVSSTTGESVSGTEDKSATEQVAGQPSEREAAAAETAGSGETHSANQPKPRPKRHVGRAIGYTVLIIFLLAIISMGTYALLRPEAFVEQKDQYMAQLREFFQRSGAEPAETLVVDEEEPFWTEEEPVQTVTDEEVNPVENEGEVSGERRFYVIVGGFGNPANADNLVASLKARFPNAANLGLNAKGTLTMVGIGPYTQAEAEQKAKELESTYKDCWVLEK